VIVVDTNILVSLLLPGALSARAQALLKRDGQWAAPVLWRSEFRNVLAGYLRQGALDFDQALSVQREAESLMAGAEYTLTSDTILPLVRDSDCSAYDCEFVALAIHLNTRLVTMDTALLKAFPGRTVSLRRLS
jgi:predicted nucleic acid-binding protein